MPAPTSVFSAPPDWSNPVTDKVSYLTNVITANDDSEQRIQLRGVPNRLVSWSVLGITARQAATIDAMLYAQQADRVGVPFWPDMSWLTSAATNGDMSIAADTTSRSFGVTAYALLWADMWTYKVVAVDTVSVTDSAIPLLNALSGPWPVGTAVIPLLAGYHAASIARTRPSRETGSSPVSFSIEVAE